MPVSTPVLEHRFNDDLLISEHDQPLAQAEYREITTSSITRSCAKSLRYDSVANSAKLWVQRIGLLAVVLAGLALLSSAMTAFGRAYSEHTRVATDSLFWAEVGGLSA